MTAPPTEQVWPGRLGRFCMPTGWRRSVGGRAVVQVGVLAAPETADVPRPASRAPPRPSRLDAAAAQPADTGRRRAVGCAGATSQTRRFPARARRRRAVQGGTATSRPSNTVPRAAWMRCRSAFSPLPRRPTYPVRPLGRPLGRLGSTPLLRSPPTPDGDVPWDAQVRRHRPEGSRRVPAGDEPSKGEPRRAVQEE
jgi:hypothetical protein